MTDETNSLQMVVLDEILWPFDVEEQLAEAANEVERQDATVSSVSALAQIVVKLIDEVERLTVERDRARDVAVALEQELARVLDLSRGWDKLARNIKNPHLAYNEGWADAKFGCADDIQRLLETETQQ